MSHFHLTDTEAELKMKASEKRVRVPKLTTSLVHDNDESLLSQENEISNIVKRRKVKYYVILKKILRNF